MLRLSTCHLAIAIITIHPWLQQVEAGIEYCSSLNTASTGANSSIYQSNGLCTDFCQSTYAFAILQDYDCWCSDYAPGVTVSDSECTTTCPGYPSDNCGGENLYAYLELSIAPKGTQGASTSSQAQAETTSTTPEATSTPQVTVTTSAGPNTVFATITLSPSPSPSPSPSSPTSSAARTSSPVAVAHTTTSTTPEATTSTTPEAAAATTTTPAAVATPTTTVDDPTTSSTWTPTPITSLETVTGQVRTVFITPTSPPDSSSQTSAVTSKKSGGLGTGGAVGLTIGLVAAVAIIGALLFFWKKRRDTNGAAGGSTRTSPKGSMAELPQRTLSESSRYMLNSDGRQVVEGWEGDSEGPASRRSRLMPVDPRLDPFAPVYQGRASHESINTLQDNHDYSRKVLRTTNPDV